MNETTRPDSRRTSAAPLLIDSTWLEARLGAEGIRPVDLRDAEAFASGHVPGAVHLDLEALGEGRDGLENVLLGPEAFATLVSSLGISDGDHVVAYDDQWGLAAARLVWACHRYGHGGVSVLDGGWDRWHGEKRPAEAGPSHGGTGRLEARVDDTVFADAEWISERPADVVLVDTRSGAEFERGRLPGAVCWDWFNAVPPGSWDAARDAGELRREWSEIGITPEREVVVYCRTGMRAAHTYMTLRHAGFERVRLYDGSWQDWSRRDLPAEEGSDGD